MKQKEIFLQFEGGAWLNKSQEGIFLWLIGAQGEHCTAVQDEWIAVTVFRK